MARLVITREAVLAVYTQGPDAVVTLVQTLVERINALEARVEALEARLAQDSHNSSQPPSADVTRIGRAPKSLRGKSGKPPGGQPGHPGATLPRRDAPDAVVTHGPGACAQCGHVFVPTDPPAQPLPTERRQVFELPPRTLVCTEHRVAERTCPVCGTPTRGTFPAAVRTTTQYGPGVRAFGVTLTSQHLLPVQRAADVLSAVVGQRVSPATLLAAERRAATAVMPAVARIHTGLTRSAVVHFDDTGFFVGAGPGPLRRHWLHVGCTPALSYYAAHAQRGTGAHAAIGLLPAVTGTAVHDGYHSFQTYTQCRHALCGAHLLRELTFLAEDGAPATRRWAAAFKRALLTMKRATDRARAAGATGLDRATLGRYHRRYTALLALGEAAEPPPSPVARAGGRPGRRVRSPGARLLYRLRRDQDAVLRFLRDLAVPFDNSEAERDLRMMKVEQKVSGGFRTPNGAATFCTLRSYLVTARKQGVAALDALHLALTGHAFHPAVPE